MFKDTVLAAWAWWQENWQVYVGLALTVDSGLTTAGYKVPLWVGIALTALAGLHTSVKGGKMLMAARAKKAE